jgi:hypothetical protein
VPLRCTFGALRLMRLKSVEIRSAHSTSDTASSRSLLRPGDLTWDSGRDQNRHNDSAARGAACSVPPWSIIGFVLLMWPKLKESTA